MNKPLEDMSREELIELCKKLKKEADTFRRGYKAAFNIASREGAKAQEFYVQEGQQKFYY